MKTGFDIQQIDGIKFKSFWLGSWAGSLISREFRIFQFIINLVWTSCSSRILTMVTQLRSLTWRMCGNRSSFLDDITRLGTHTMQEVKKKPLANNRDDKCVYVGTWNVVTNATCCRICTHELSTPLTKLDYMENILPAMLVCISAYHVFHDMFEFCYIQFE